jgi:hypothetical protein
VGMTQALLDSLAAAVQAKRPPAELALLHERFNGSLGADGALDLPTRPVDLGAGRAIYEQQCAKCHGVTGQGTGRRRQDDRRLPSWAVRSRWRSCSASLRWGSPARMGRGVRRRTRLTTAGRHLLHQFAARPCHRRPRGHHIQRCAGCQRRRCGRRHRSLPSARSGRPQLVCVAGRAERRAGHRIRAG